MTDDMAVGMPGRGWSAVGGRVLTPGRAATADVSRPTRGSTDTRGAAPALRGHVSMATSDGLLGPSRRGRHRAGGWVRYAVLWLAVVLLMPLAAGWAWGLVN